MCSARLPSLPALASNGGGNSVLEERPPLRLRVQPEDGSPLSGALVALNTTNETEAWQRFLTTDASGAAVLQIRPRPGPFFFSTPVEATGALEIEGLPAQPYDVVLARPGSGTFPLGEIEVLPRDPFDFGEILLPPAGSWSPVWPIPDAPEADAYELVRIDALEGLKKLWKVTSGATPPPPSLALLPGKYEWKVYGAGALLRRQTFEVE